MKGTKPKRGLTGEDRELWRRVARTVDHADKDKYPDLKESMARLMQQSASLGSKPVTPASVASEPQPSLFTSSTNGPESHPIEDKVARKLAKGKQKIDSRIDLHGMTQDAARSALLDFLLFAQQAGHRMVLVITGKGNEGRGVLRNNVPRWLDLPPFSPLINGWRVAHLSHGGEGAIYVRIRRRRNQ